MTCWHLSVVDVFVRPKTCLPVYLSKTRVRLGIFFVVNLSESLFMIFVKIIVYIIILVNGYLFLIKPKQIGRAHV